MLLLLTFFLTSSSFLFSSITEEILDLSTLIYTTAVTYKSTRCGRFHRHWHSELLLNLLSRGKNECQIQLGHCQKAFMLYTNKDGKLFVWYRIRNVPTYFIYTSLWVREKLIDYVVGVFKSVDFFLSYTKTCLRVPFLRLSRYWNWFVFVFYILSIPFPSRCLSAFPNVWIEIRFCFLDSHLERSYRG